MEGLFRGVHAPMSVGNLAGSQGRGCQGLSSSSIHSRYLGILVGTEVPSPGSRLGSRLPPRGNIRPCNKSQLRARIEEKDATHPAHLTPLYCRKSPYQAKFGTQTFHGCPTSPTRHHPPSALVFLILAPSTVYCKCSTSAMLFIFKCLYPAESASARQTSAPARRIPRFEDISP